MSIPNTFSLDQWLARIEALHPQEIEMGLGRIAKVYQRLPSLLSGPKVISLAGTNGKGTTGRLLEQILLSAGYSVGCYSSPHLVRFNERIRICGVEVDDQALCHSFERVEQARGDIELTFFEFTTLAAFDLFAGHQLDVVILEVGLGARLDAVNLIDPDVAVITSVALDHQAFLGDTRDQIGWEKAHLFRADRPAVCGDPHPPQRVLALAAELNAKLYCQGQDFQAELTASSWRWRGKTSTATIEFADLPVPGIPLNNASTALQVLACLPMAVSEDAIRQGLSKTQLSGRCQYLSQPFPLLLDVAHNQEAAEYLAAYLKHHFPNRKVQLLLGLLADKDSEKIVHSLVPAIAGCWTTNLNSPRARSATSLAKEISPIIDSEVRCFNSVDNAMQFWDEQAKSDDQLLLITGSFYTVGAALQWLQNRQGEHDG